MDKELLFQQSVVLPSEKIISCNIYEVGGKLLVTSEKFIGYNPFVIALDYPAEICGKKTFNSQDVFFQNSHLTINLNCFFGVGLLRVFEGGEVVKDAIKILEYDHGVCYFFYSAKGNTCYMENNTVYLILQKNY